MNEKKKPKSCPVCQMPTDRWQHHLRAGAMVPEEALVCSACQHNHLAPLILELRNKQAFLLSLVDRLGKHRKFVNDEGEEEQLRDTLEDFKEEFKQDI